MSDIRSFRDLKVYQKLRTLHLQISELSLAFPKFEMYELGSQIRRSSNAAPAIWAEGWGSRHTNIYLEAINRSMGEVRETQHHSDIAAEKKYWPPETFQEIDQQYEACGRMLERLYAVLSQWRGSKRQTPPTLREASEAYSATPHDEWTTIISITAEIDDNPITHNPKPKT